MTAERDDLHRLVVNSAPWVFQSLYVAAKLGLADQLAEGDRTSDELAAATDSHSGAVYRFCRALAALGVLAEQPGRRFALTPLGAGLRSDAPGGLSHFVIVNGEESFRAWADVMYAVRTGLPAFDHVFGMSHFEFLERNADSSRSFNGMAGRGTPPKVLDSYDFTGATVVADIGGGMGGLIVQILAANPRMRGILQDLPGGVAQSGEFLREHGLADRVEVVGRSFFEFVPAGADVYVLSRVVHDWNDTDALRLLGRVRAAMKPSSRLVLIDNVIPEVPGYHIGKFSDLQMLVVLGGQERTADEVVALLAKAEFEVTRTIMPDPVPGSPRAEALIECRLR